MKNIISGFMALLLFSFSTLVYASPEYYEAETSAEESSIQILSSDNGDVRVQNVENVIENRADLAAFVNPVTIISGINDDRPFDFEERTCAFCWAFAFLLLMYLYEYGQKIKNKKKFKSHWFIRPLVMAIIIYVLHAVVHVFLASPIFLEYYWMIIFDELVFAYLIYYYHYRLGTKKIARNNIGSSKI